jgi:hypothetical protein
MKELAVLPQEESGVRPEYTGAIRPERGHRPGRFVRVIGVRRPEPAARVPELPLSVPAQAAAVAGPAELAVERALARAEANRLLAELRRQADLAMIGYAPDPFNFGIW